MMMMVVMLMMLIRWRRWRWRSWQVSVHFSFCWQQHTEATNGRHVCRGRNVPQSCFPKTNSIASKQANMDRMASEEATIIAIKHALKPSIIVSMDRIASMLVSKYSKLGPILQLRFVSSSHCKMNVHSVSDSLENSKDFGLGTWTRGNCWWATGRNRRKLTKIFVETWPTLTFHTNLYPAASRQ